MNTMKTTTRSRRRRAGAAAIVAVTAGLVFGAACGTSSSDTTSTTPGYASELRPVLDDLVASMKVPSAVVLVRSSTYGDATFSFGSTVLGGDDAPTPSDRYRIGSITKTMTATVILQLAQEGLLSLDDPISKYQPDVPNGDNITIAELADMRSGLHGYDVDPVFTRAVDEAPERAWTPQDVLEIGYSEPALFPPGTAYDYSNTNYVLLGLVMEQVTGQTASELFQQRLFEPLGLDDTVLPALDAPIPPVDAHGYMFASVEQTGSDHPALNHYQQQAAADGELVPTDWTASDPSWAWTAGSAISTADDIARWGEALVDGELLDAEMQAYRLASQVPTDPTQPDGTAYGSGMLRSADGYYGHAGLTFGYNTQVLRNPDTDTTIVVLTGLSLAPDGRMPVGELTNAVIVELADTPQ